MLASTSVAKRLWRKHLSTDTEQSIGRGQMGLDGKRLDPFTIKKEASLVARDSDSHSGSQG
jgi:hypothetical protein